VSTNKQGKLSALTYMASDNWFRHTDWNAEIETAFFEKLHRSRDKKQYLRIQAGTIASSIPEVALRLLDEYFALGDHFDQAQAHADRASAYLALGDIDHAFAALEAALAREEEYPRFLTYAYLDLPFLIAIHRVEPRYKQALDLLERHKARLTFPVDHFRWHAARALIFSAQAHTASAREHARLALAAAAKDRSGFRYHPSVGLVGTKHADIRHQLSIAAA
jgi:tetratricopeptide (TPR) repeat protein